MGADRYEGSSAEGVEKSGAEEEQRLLPKNGRDSRDDDVAITVPSLSRFGYNADNRPCRDVGYAIAFLLFVTATLGVGIFGVFNQNSDYQSVQSAIYDHHYGCKLPDESYNGASSASAGFSGTNVRNLLGAARMEEKDPSVKIVLYVLLVTLGLCVPLAWLLFCILRTYTKELVYVTLPFFVIVPLAFYGTFFQACYRSESCWENFDATVQYTTFGFVVVVNVLFVWVLYKNWDRVELTIRIVRTACEALYKNLGLLFVLPALNAAYSLYLLPAGLLLFFAYTNGKIVPNPELAKDAGQSCGGSSDITCCVWEVDAWVPAYMAMTGFVILWGALIVSHIRVYAVSGAISQWYFATTLSSTVGTTKRSLRHALGPSFGTLCFSGLVSAFVQLIRSAIESSQGDQGHVGFAAILVRACLECILSAVEFLTKFTTNFAAITGESFCDSAVMTFNLLKRNLLSTLVVESVAGRLLAQVIIVFTAAYGLLVWGVLAVVFHGEKHLWIGPLFSCVLLGFFLAYCAQVLDCVIDTVYICYAMDKDQNEVSKPEVHDVYVLLPPNGSASLAVPQESRG